ncbi:MAG: hypothetical protein HZA90_19110 [Verrucomicrobia bacterium]|nr:hypothetical protein [Verrucomicrobiota bacterium]
MKTRPGLWNSLALEAGVLADWRWALGGEFDKALHFLQATQEQSQSYPCTEHPVCHCTHEIRETDVGLVAVCVCGGDECSPIWLEPKDTLIYALNAAKLGEAVRRALGFDAATGTAGHGLRGAIRIGTHGPGRIPVLFYVPYDETALLKELESILSAQAGPFILATPTAACHSATVEQMQHRHGFLLLPLAGALGVEDGGQLRAISPIDAVLTEFAKRLGEGRGLVKTVERIDRNIEALAKGTYELRQENEDLRRLHAEGHLKFALSVDGEDFRAFTVIMALGNRKAAAEFLEVPLRTFYDRVDKWQSKAGAYRRMWRFVEWQRTQERKIKVRLDESLLSGDSGGAAENPETIRAVLTKMKEEAVDRRDYPEILRQILEALASQNGGNWAAVRDEVVAIIKEELPQ